MILIILFIIYLTKNVLSNAAIFMLNAFCAINMNNKYLFYKTDLYY